MRLRLGSRGDQSSHTAKSGLVRTTIMHTWVSLERSRPCDEPGGLWYRWSRGTAGCPRTVQSRTVAGSFAPQAVAGPAGGCWSSLSSRRTSVYRSECRTPEAEEQRAVGTAGVPWVKCTDTRCPEDRKYTASRLKVSSLVNIHYLLPQF